MNTFYDRPAYDEKKETRSVRETSQEIIIALIASQVFSKKVIEKSLKNRSENKKNASLLTDLRENATKEQKVFAKDDKAQELTETVTTIEEKKTHKKSSSKPEGFHKNYNVPVPGYRPKTNTQNNRPGYNRPGNRSYAQPRPTYHQNYYDKYFPYCNLNNHSLSECYRFNRSKPRRD